MEAFSDGVLAIAITLLVLDLALRPPGSPLEQFLRDWPSYLVYLVSFLTIGAAWIAHNSLTGDLDHIDRIFLRLNLLFLLSVSFLPFPTRIVGDALEKGTSWQRVAAPCSESRYWQPDCCSAPWPPTPDASTCDDRYTR